MIPDQLKLIAANGVKSDLPLKESFFVPSSLNEDVIDGLLRGAAHYLAEEVDEKMVDALRNFLFGPPGNEFGLDLGMINIQRGRDHGLPSYKSVQFQLATTGKLKKSAKAILEGLYADPGDVDLWVGLLSEEHRGRAAMGPTLVRILKNQFDALRAGDRFWYENDADFAPGGPLFALGYGKTYIEKRKLSKIIIDNTYVEPIEIPSNVFVYFGLDEVTDDEDDGGGPGRGFVYGPNSIRELERELLCVVEEEVCDGKDNDCDGDIDEGLSCIEDAALATFSGPNLNEQPAETSDKESKGCNSFGSATPLSSNYLLLMGLSLLLRVRRHYYRSDT